MKNNIQLEEAQNLLLDSITPVGKCLVALLEASGRVLSQAIKASTSIPPFSKSALDGYALIASDTRQAESSAPVQLRVIEETRAGFVAKEKVVSGTTIKVMTGAPIPCGANAFIKYEDVIRNGDLISIFRALKAQDNVIMMGDDIERGEVIAHKGSLVTPPLVALLAGLGISQVPVYAKAKIAIMSTGDELLDPSEELQPGKIYNSSLYGLMARCSEMGAQPLDLGIVPDEIEATTVRISRGLEKADIVVSTGGVSVGDYDVMKDAMVGAGAEIIFWKVAMKPGSPVVAAVKDKKLIIGLSGNPAAAMVTFDLIVIPLIKRLMGINNPLPDKIQGVFADNFLKASSQRRFLRAKLERKDGVDCLKLTGAQGNGVLMSMIGCNVLVDIPAGSGPVISGQSVSGHIVGNITDAFHKEPAFTQSVVSSI
ncbi:molybdopterin molybdotransferase MoeA [Desulfosporosinus fructosivorans]|uniref:Molybdopterin molybdenumtransferase n=1 Tax=Desulfosporosinus fructosivorans TaxID=2018669 RepID=A0A4Z0R721_9FIRM|nr:gephyrin-like molybdotransferase Glp [Desulfosporosinus fructosivorans]TGE38354.1 molybdopterin molybdotransferase MoeA [Desulfosporosinus fructosivorans]